MATPKPLGEPQWLPLDAAVFYQRMDTWSHAESHAIFKAMLAAWRGPDMGWPACSIPADVDTLERLLRVPWEDMGRVLRAHFTPHPNAPDYLRCEPMFAQYTTVQTKRRTQQIAAETASFFAKKKRDKSKGSKRLVQDGDRAGVQNGVPDGGKSNPKTTTRASGDAGGDGALGADAPHPSPEPPAPREPGPSVFVAIEADDKARAVMPPRFRNSDHQGLTQ